MTATLTAEEMADELAVSVAHVVAAANRRARHEGWNVAESLVTITQHFDDGWLWRVNYGPKNPASLRGGDLLVELDAANAEVKRVLRGQ